MDNLTWSYILTAIGFGVNFTIAIISLWKTRGIEELKAAEQRQTERFKIAFSQLYVERAQIIKRTYKDLCRLEKLLKRGLDSKCTQEEQVLWFRETNTAFDSFLNTWEEDKLFFSPHLCGLIDKGIEKLKATMYDITFKDFFAGIDKIIIRVPEKESSSMYEQHINRIKDILTNSFPAIKQEIAGEFRTLLGIDEEKRVILRNGL